MLAKISSENQITLPKAVVEQVAPAQYFEVEAVGDQIVLTPVRLNAADAVRAKLAELDFSDQDLEDAVVWARRGP